KMHSMLKQHQVSNQGVLKEIKAVVEKDVSLKNEITQLSNSQCDCGNDNTTRWSFPIICMILWPLYFWALMLWVTHNIFYKFLLTMNSIGLALNCPWSGGPP
ncbi:MAG TPA: hypothetical protein VMT57_03650, partial [Candidatus Thermoplasmatota archaeon]|nr:hypothetical protein [Candidatus Thermoplasmatota archaeon]